MSSESIKASQLLQEKLVCFFDELIEMFPNDSNFVIGRIMVKDRIPITEIVKQMTTYLLPEKDNIKSAVKNALSGNPAPFNDKVNQLFYKFGGADDAQAITYKKTFDNLDDESKIAIWKWLHVFTHLIEKCQV